VIAQRHHDVAYVLVHVLIFDVSDLQICTVNIEIMKYYIERKIKVTIKGCIPALRRWLILQPLLAGSPVLIS
jgi:hypothetical protein